MSIKRTVLKIKTLFLCVNFATTILGMEENGVQHAQQLYLSDAQEDWCIVDLRDTVKPVLGKKDPLVLQVQLLQKAVAQAQEVFAKEKDMFFVMMRRTSPNFCAEVEQALISNFQNTGIDHTKVYKFIGLPLLRANNMTHGKVLRYLSSRHRTGKLTDRQHRQLEYPFKTAESKIEYDMFCQGRLPELVLSQREAQAMCERFSKITGFGLKLADLEALTRQLPEQLS